MHKRKWFPIAVLCTISLVLKLLWIGHNELAHDEPFTVLQAPSMAAQRTATAALIPRSLSTYPRAATGRYANQSEQGSGGDCASGGQIDRSSVRGW